jgi:two-component system phosphate regulon sensor histidine kinase PhoR
MRTPITALKGLLELLVDGAKDDPAVRDDFLTTLQAEADRLARLVTDLLTLARLESGGLQLEVAPQWAGDMLRDVATVMETLAADAGVTLRVEAPDDLKVSADRDRIVQVLLGFTDNALKHSPPGTTVTLSAELEGDAAALAVCDQGEGIAPEDLERVFERFYRADGARSGGMGTGLGLAIAKEIVEAHGSTIRVSSTVGEGTSFRFRLPLA